MRVAGQRRADMAGRSRCVVACGTCPRPQPLAHPLPAPWQEPSWGGRPPSLHQHSMTCRAASRTATCALREATPDDAGTLAAGMRNTKPDRGCLCWFSRHVAVAVPHCGPAAANKPLIVIGRAHCYPTTASHAGACAHLYAASHAGLMLGRGVTVPWTRRSCHNLKRPGRLLK